MSVDPLTGVIRDDETGEELRYPLQSQDVDQATWLARELGNEVRYNHATKQWHHWDTTSCTWAPDTVKDVENRVIELGRVRVAKIASISGKDKEVAAAVKLVRRLFDIARIRSALDVLSSMPGYKTDGQDWDLDPYLLGCANGVVDLRTGTFVEGLTAANGKVTKNTHIAFDPEAKCPLFLEFLPQITSGDKDLAAFFVQWFGYSLYGLNWEQRFLVLTGEGRNGKGAMTRAVRAAIGDYCAKADQGIYMKSKWGSARSSDARADLMALRGTRVAVLSEPEGGQFNEELLKAHTGGDVISARPLYGTIVSWEPSHTITFLTNKMPTVEDIGPAMAERVLVADFRERYEGERKDTSLDEKLRAEAPGILALLIRSAAIYWRDRMAGEPFTYPARVANASKAYLAANDPMGTALAEAFVLEPGAKGYSRDLYQAYLDWHAKSDDPNETLSQTAFGLLLQRRGCKRRRAEQGSVYIGIRPRSALEMALAEDQASE